MSNEFLLILNELSIKHPNNYDLGEKVRLLVNSDFFQKEIDEIKEIKKEIN